MKTVHSPPLRPGVMHRQEVMTVKEDRRAPRMTIREGRTHPGVQRKLHQHAGIIKDDGPRDPLPIRPCYCSGEAVPVGTGPSGNEVLYLCTNPDCDSGIRTTRIENLVRDGYIKPTTETD